MNIIAMARLVENHIPYDLLQQGDLARDGAAYCGKVRGNFLGTEFTSYDDGISPGKASSACRTPPLLYQTRGCNVEETHCVMGFRCSAQENTNATCIKLLFK